MSRSKNGFGAVRALIIGMRRFQGVFFCGHNMRRLLFVCTLLVGCKSSDRNMGNDQTANKLASVFEIMKAISHTGLEDFSCKYNMDELLNYLKRRGYIDVSAYLFLSEDAWGNKFILEMNHNPREISFTFFSKGSNGVFEEGQGDDLFLRIRWADREIKEVTLREVFESGKGKIRSISK